MVQVCLSLTLVLQLSLYLVENFSSNNFFMFLIYARISSLFVNFPLTMMFSLSFTLLFLLLRIARPGSQFIMAHLRMAFITSFRRQRIHLHPKHSLVRGLLHIVGTTVWDIQLFERSTLFYPSFSLLFYPIRQ